MGELRTPQVMAFWSEFCAGSGVDPGQRFDVFAFGDSPELSDRLGRLVVTGPKRATAGLRSYFEPHTTEALPEVGVHSVVVDGRGQPLAVIRTTEVQVKPLVEVDDAFAWDEGEGDRSLAYWMDAHRRYFTRQLAAEGLTFTEDLPVVLERFELLWTADGAPTA